MKRSLVWGSLAAALIFIVPTCADADTASATSTTGSSVADVLIHRDVVNNNDDAVGTIYGVTLNSAGRVDYVVIDVSAWIGSSKLISVPWRDLSVDSDGNVRTSLTKDAVKKSTDYTAKLESKPSMAMPVSAIPDKAISDNRDLYRARPTVYENRPD
jgi:hypothetical protein